MIVVVPPTPTNKIPCKWKILSDADAALLNYSTNVRRKTTIKLCWTKWTNANCEISIGYGIHAFNEQLVGGGFFILVLVLLLLLLWIASIQLHNSAVSAYWQLSWQLVRCWCFLCLYPFTYLQLQFACVRLFTSRLYSCHSCKRIDVYRYTFPQSSIFRIFNLLLLSFVFSQTMMNCRSEPHSVNSFIHY